MGKKQEAESLLAQQPKSPCIPPQKQSPPDTLEHEGSWLLQGNFHVAREVSIREQEVKSRRVRKQLGEEEGGRWVGRRRQAQTQIAPPKCAGPHFASLCAQDCKSCFKSTARGHVVWGLKGPKYPNCPRRLHRRSRQQ